MNKENNFVRLLGLLLLALAMSLALYGLPDELLGYTIKKVDLLSDIRVKPTSSARDSLEIILATEEVEAVDSTALREAAIQSAGIDSIALAKRDSLYKAVYSEAGADVSGKHIEDYSPGHIAMKRFFTALNNREKMDRPVRVAFLGDSFVEGDIFVADLRSGLQKEYGGRGVGFVTVTSVAAQYRPTIEQKASGWTTHSIINDQEHRFTLPGMTFEAAAEKATLSVKTTNRYPEITEVNSLTFYYEQNSNTRMELVINGSDSLGRTLPPTEKITHNIQTGNITEARFNFSNTQGFKALGVALEDDRGVVVDNFSLRGNSGLVLEKLDAARCAELTAIRPYDLIILQYGLNVASEEMLSYGWYGQGMTDVIKHIQSCFPNADILMLSVSDRSIQEDGKFVTMPAVMSLLHTQRQTAKRTGIAFWNLFGGMGGENSMVRYVDNNWASKDYTHLSFRGGREIAKALLEALKREKEFYDEAEKALP